MVNSSKAVGLLNKKVRLYGSSSFKVKRVKIDNLMLLLLKGFYYSYYKAANKKAPVGACKKLPIGA